MLAAALALLACGGGPKPPDVLIITVDTLRADHIGAYGASPEATPRIDRLAREGTVFENAAAPMPLTRPTHASLMTGLYPRELGVVNNALSLSGERETLAERLLARGYRTGAFVSVSLLSAAAGIQQGFEVFQHPNVPRSRPAGDAVPEALAWLGSLDPAEPYFLWVHLFDPHLPYAPPAGYRGGADPSLAARLPEVSWSQLRREALEHGGDVPADVLEHARHLYRGEVAYVDEWVGRLIEGVEALRPLDQTLVVFTADHGECFAKGVYFEHADCLQEDALRVPLIVRHPPEFAAGGRVASQVSSIDVTPTVLRTLGEAVPEGLAGRALQDVGPDEERYVLVQHPVYDPKTLRDRLALRGPIRTVAGDPVQPLLAGAERVGVVGAHWKYLRDASGGELMALSAGSERPAPPAARSEVAARLEAELDGQLARHPLAALEPVEMDDELRETLRALGYLGDEAGDGARAGADEARPATAAVDPKERERLQALGYVDVVMDPLEGPDGVVTSDRERMQPGLTYFTNAHGCSSHLVDETGELVRSWSHEPCDRWDNSILLPDGDVLAVHRAPGPVPDGPVERRLVRLSWEGEVKAEIDLPVHHDVDWTPTGLIAAMTHRHRPVPDLHPSVEIRDHGIAILDADGTFAEEVSLLDVLRRTPGFHLRVPRPRIQGGRHEVDLMHSNSVEFVRREALASVDPLYAPGNVLICIRNQDAVIMMDWSGRRVRWTWGPGELSGPHDATLLANGNVLIFDNRPGEDASRVVEVDPRSDEIVWEYRGPEPGAFYSQTRGAAERLDNGNTLITDSAHGRIFEVTREGDVVWDYRNPFRDDEGRPIAIVRARRVLPAEGDGARFRWSD